MNLKIEHLSKHFGKRHLFSIEALELASGSIYGLMGPNGTGKTTILKMLAGLDKPDKGSILYNGVPWHDSLRQDITYLSQKAYMMNASVFENVAWPMHVRGKSKSEKASRVSEALERMNISELSERKATTLSGGEAQKVALARALVFEPKLLLMDEPAASLDKEASKLFETRLLDFHAETGATVILVTHSSEQAMRCCSELLWLSDGAMTLEVMESK